MPCELVVTSGTAKPSVLQFVFRMEDAAHP